MKYKRMAQFRYYGENNPYNFPNNILNIITTTNAGQSTEIVECPTATSLIKYSPISSIHITTIPGTILYLHIADTQSTSVKYVVGATGTLSFDELYFGLRGVEIDVESVKTLKANKENFFVMTIIYEVEVSEEEEG